MKHTYASDHESLKRHLTNRVRTNDIIEPQKQGAYYDKGTGTFFCSGKTITKNIMERAREHFRLQMEDSREIAKKEPQMEDFYLVNTIAYNAIALLMDDLIEFKNEQAKSKGKSGKNTIISAK